MGTDRTVSVRWSLTRRDGRTAYSRALVFVTLVALGLGFVAVASSPAAAASAPSTDCVGSGSGALYVTDTGLTVEENDSTIHWGTFPAADTVAFESIQFTAAGPASLRLEQGAGNGTCLGALNATAHDVTVTFDDETPIVFSGRLTAVGLTPPEFDDSTTDLTYDAPAPFSVEVVASGVEAGRTVRAETPSGRVLDETTVSDAGTATFTLPAGSEAVRFTAASGASFTVEDRRLNSTAVEVGDAVQVSATVTNTGAESGQLTVTYAVDGERQGETDVTLDAGSATSVAFTHPFETAGTYAIDLAGQRVGTVTVTAPSTENTSSEDGSSTTDGGGNGGNAGSSRSSGSGGGGGSSGGGGGDPSDGGSASDADSNGGSTPTRTDRPARPSLTRTQIEDGYVLTVADGTANATVTEKLALSGPEGTAETFSLSAVSIHLGAEADGFDTTVTRPSTSPGTAPAAQHPGILGYVSVTTDAKPEAVRSSVFSLTLSEATLSEIDTLQTVRVYQYTESGWVRLNVTVGAGDRTVNATAPRLAPIAVGVGSPPSSDTETASPPTDSDTPTGTDDPTPDEGDRATDSARSGTDATLSADGPGFDLRTAGVVLLLTVAVGRARQLV